MERDRNLNKLNNVITILEQAIDSLNFARDMTMTREERGGVEFLALHRVIDAKLLIIEVKHAVESFEPDLPF